MSKLSPKFLTNKDYLKYLWKIFTKVIFFDLDSEIVLEFLEFSFLFVYSVLFVFFNKFDATCL